MQRRRSPESLALEAMSILGIGLILLTVAALALYHPGAARWTHEFVNGSAWLLVLTTGAMLMVAGTRKVLDLARGGLGR